MHFLGLVDLLLASTEIEEYESKGVVVLLECK